MSNQDYILKQKIFILGKESAINNVIKSILDDELMHKYEIMIFDSSENFDRMIIENNPCLIIISSRYFSSLIPEIKKLKSPENPPVFFLCGSCDTEDFLASEADFFLSKPIDINKLITQTKSAINFKN